VSVRVFSFVRDKWNTAVRSDERRRDI